MRTLASAMAALAMALIVGLAAGAAEAHGKRRGSPNVVIVPPGHDVIIVPSRPYLARPYLPPAAVRPYPQPFPPRFDGFANPWGSAWPRADLRYTDPRFGSAWPGHRGFLWDRRPSFGTQLHIQRRW